MKSVNAFVAKLFGDSAVTSNARDNEIRRAFLPGDRYRVDFAEDFKAEGWEQFDTDQDASYFGVWVNKGTRQTLTYAEGDWTLVTCPDRAGYVAEIEDAIQFYGEGRIATSYDQDGAKTIYRQDRAAFLAD